MSGVNVRDNCDWYHEANKLYPETAESLETRYDLVADYYKTLAVPAGKSLCVIVVTHKPMTFNLPCRLGEMDEECDATGYCCSFSVKVELNQGGRGEPEIVDQLDEDYIVTRRERYY